MITVALITLGLAAFVIGWAIGVFCAQTWIVNALQADRGYRDTKAVEIASGGHIKAKKLGPPTS